MLIRTFGLALGMAIAIGAGVGSPTGGLVPAGLAREHPRPVVPVNPEETRAAGTSCEPVPVRLLAEVVRIDPGAGVVTLVTSRGRLELKMTAPTLRQLDVGDRLVVELVDEPAMPDPEDPICI